jgi:hypothetical protein
MLIFGGRRKLFQFCGEIRPVLFNFNLFNLQICKNKMMGCWLNRFIHHQLGLNAASPRSYLAAGFSLPSRSHSAMEYK